MNDVEELKERMNQTDEIVNTLVQKTTALEKKEITFPEVPDYRADFEQLERHLQDDAVERNKQTGEIKDLVKRHDLQYPAKEILKSIEQLTKLHQQTAGLLPVKHHHTFDLKMKGWIIGGFILLIVTAFATGISLHLSAENSKLQANSIKYRMIRQAFPAQANWADKYYNHDPDEMEQTTAKLEDEASQRSASENPNNSNLRPEPNKKSKKAKP